VVRDFTHRAAPARVVFGAGAVRRIPDESAALGLHRVLVMAGGSAAAIGERLVQALGSRAAATFTRVAPHVPEEVVEQATTAARSAGADGLCSIGGGSATGLAKAVAASLDLPIMAVPTTYAGSEATPIYGITGQQGKHTATDPRVVPRTVVYDPELTVGLPARATAASAFNALAHATAALSASTYDPVAHLYATEAIRLITPALPVAVRTPADLDARGDLLWAAWLAGSALAATGAGLHHKLCHLLGGRYALVHAEVHAVLLRHTVACDTAGTVACDTAGTVACDTAGTVAVARALGGRTAADAVDILGELADRVGVPGDLAAIGLPADALDELARQAADIIGGHDPTWFRDLLDRAYHTHKITHDERKTS
jgi:maleylacetate reductase